jgi:antitoxin component YwqK of YwqJK toxin-antitoxin module
MRGYFLILIFYILTCILAGCIPLDHGIGKTHYYTDEENSTVQQNLPDSGFTNKAEAKNQMVKGKKEGKWVEYDSDSHSIDFGGYNRRLKDTGRNSLYYRLIIYKTGVPYGIVRDYLKNGRLYLEETPDR